MKLLVTGGAGFIGSNFIRSWLADHPSDEAVNLDLLTYAGDRASLADVERGAGRRYTFARGDIADEAAVMFERDARVVAPDAVVLAIALANDIWNNDWSFESRYPTAPKPFFTLEGGGLVLTPAPPIGTDVRISSALARSTFLSALKSGLIEPFSFRGVRAEQLGVLEDPQGEWQRAWDITERLGGAARSANVPLLIVLIPDPCQVHANSCAGRPDLSSSDYP